MECIRGQVRWSGMHARTLVSECYSQLASISHEAHHSRTRECQGEGNHQRAFRSFPQHKLREKCMQAEVCYHMRRGGRKSTKPKSSISSRFGKLLNAKSSTALRFGARSPSAQRVLEAVRSRFERPFAALDRRSRSWTHRRPFASLVYVCVRWGGNPSPVVNDYHPNSTQSHHSETPWRDCSLSALHTLLKTHLIESTPY